MTLHQRFFPFFFAETFLTSLLHRKMFLGEKETAVRLLMPIKFTIFSSHQLEAARYLNKK